MVVVARKAMACASTTRPSRLSLDRSSRLVRSMTNSSSSSSKRNPARQQEKIPEREKKKGEEKERKEKKRKWGDLHPDSFKTAARKKACLILIMRNMTNTGTNRAL